MTDLLARTATLVDIASVSHTEEAIADHIESQLRAAGPGLEITRIGHNLIARTDLGRPERLLLAGHVDTVPANGNERARIEGDTLFGLGSADMKSGVAAFLELALALARVDPSPAVDVTFVFYVCEEVEQRYSGLIEIEAARPDLLAADAAVLGEPTGALVEAGCQGVLRLGVTMRGERAHTARPWMGVNAVHRLAPLLARAASYVGRRPVIDGCEYREALQAVAIEGGVAANVVPDGATVMLNHRFAPDRDVEQALAELFAYLEPAIDSSRGDSIVLEGSSPSAAPGLGHPLLASLVARSGQEPRAKLGWTDVAFFTERAIPAANFGPGDPTLAHTAGEKVERVEIETVYSVLRSLIAGEPAD
jgi:succinyl-diaminopimelate desuccinylase